MCKLHNDIPDLQMSLFVNDAYGVSCGCIGTNLSSGSACLCANVGCEGRRNPL